MKFGANTFIWVSPFSDDTLNLFQKVKDMGFNTLEIAVEDPTTINVQNVKQASEETGIEITICGAFGANRDISSTDSNIRMQGLDYIKTCVDIAKQIGCELISGPMFSAVGKTNLLTPEEKEMQWQWGVENMKLAAQYAKERNIRLAVEPLNRFETDFINTVCQGRDFIDRIDMDNVGLLIDTFHMNIEEKNIGEAIRLAGDKIFNFHACGSDRGTPGEDNTKWDEVKQALCDVGYDGLVTIEAFNTGITEIAKAVSLWRELAPSPDHVASAGINFLKNLFEE